MSLFQADADAVAGALEQRGYRLQELLESEKTYIQDLSQAMAYIHFMRESKERCGDKNFLLGLKESGDKTRST